MSFAKTAQLLGPGLAALALIASTSGNGQQRKGTNPLDKVPIVGGNDTNNSAPLPPERPPQAQLDLINRGVEMHERHAPQQPQMPFPNVDGMAAQNFRGPSNNPLWNTPPSAYAPMPSAAYNQTAAPSQLMAAQYPVTPQFSPLQNNTANNAQISPMQDEAARRQAFLRSQGIGAPQAQPAQRRGLLSADSSVSNPFYAQNLYGKS